jgi:hypothetical protein
MRHGDRLVDAVGTDLVFAYLEVRPGVEAERGEALDATLFNKLVLIGCGAGLPIGPGHPAEQKEPPRHQEETQ